MPIVSDGWDNVLQEAKEAGIPVIVIDRQIDVDSSLYAGFLGENGYEEGKTAGKFLLQKTENMKKQKINILELSGTENSSIAIERAGGFREMIQKDSRLNIIHSEENLVSVELNKNINIFKMNGDIDNLKHAIITKRDLEEYNEKHRVLLTFFKRELVVKSFLFIGYTYNYI